jgi:hypothetical protein
MVSKSRRKSEEQKYAGKEENIAVYYSNVLHFSTFGLFQFVIMRNLHICTNIVEHSMLQCITVCCSVYSSEELEGTLRMSGLG